MLQKNMNDGFRKQIIAAAVLTLLLSFVSLSGCADDTQPNSVISDGGSSNSATFESSDSENFAIESDSNEAQLELDGISANDIEAVQPFSDGVSWVKTSEGLRLVDKEGLVKLDMSDTEYGSASPYIEGAAVAFDGSNCFDYSFSGEPLAIIDKEGNAIWSFEDETKRMADEVFDPEAVRDVRVLGMTGDQWRGYLIVEFEIDTFDYTGTLCGVVDSRGEWIVEPPSIEDAVEAARNGIDPGSHELSSNDEIYYDDNFLRINRQCVVLYRTGEVLPCTGLWEEVGDGLYYGGKDINDIREEEAAFAHRDRKYDGCGKFVDASGNVSLDISDLPLTKDFGGEYGGIGYEEGFAKSDYCLVRLENPNGAVYLTVIDSDGNQMFDPIRNGETGELSESAFFYKPNEKEDGWYVGIDGEQLGGVKGEEGGEFNDGRAWVKVDESWRCIDEKGEFAW